MYLEELEELMASVCTVLAANSSEPQPDHSSCSFEAYLEDFAIFKSLKVL